MTKNSKSCENVSNKNIENEKRDVSFSKRVNRVFKKASELSALPDVKVALFVYSPNKSVYTFGHPDIGLVVSNYLVKDMFTEDKADEASRLETFKELEAELTRMQEQLEEEKAKRERLEDSKKKNRASFWWAAPKDDLNLEQLQALVPMFAKLQGKVQTALELESGGGPVAAKSPEADVCPIDGTKNPKV